MRPLEEDDAKDRDDDEDGSGCHYNLRFLWATCWHIVRWMRARPLLGVPWMNSIFVGNAKVMASACLPASPVGPLPLPWRR